MDGFEKLVNGLNAKDNIDVYITGSNSHFLSSDINTIFRGRGDEIRVYPLSFREFCTDRNEPDSELWKEYYTYGGMPGLLKQHTPEQKIAYLQRLWNKTYLDDVIERHHVKNREALSTLADLKVHHGLTSRGINITKALRNIMWLMLTLEMPNLISGNRRLHISWRM